MVIPYQIQGQFVRHVSIRNCYCKVLKISGFCSSLGTGARLRLSDWLGDYPFGLCPRRVSGELLL
jgi:hypothetical protein